MLLLKVVRVLLTPGCLLNFSTMRLMVFVLALACVALAKEDAPKYSCPEVDVDFEGNDISLTEGIVSWEDCGKYGLKEFVTILHFLTRIK